ncbi:MAG: transporter [Sideroxydans sp.]
MKTLSHHELSLIARNTLLYLSLLFSATALAAEDVAEKPTEAVAARPAEVIIEKPVENVTITPSHKMSFASIGISDMSDTSVPGQEISQRDIPIAFSFETDKYVFEVSIPYITRTAPTGKVAKSHHHESKRSESTTVAAPILTTSGMGDITSSLTYKLMDEEDALISLSAKGEVKLGTADVAVGLGTGVNDYFGELAASKSLGDFSLSAGLGYAILGSPGEIEINDVKKFIYFNNIFFGSLGADYQLTDSFNVGMEIAAGQATETGGSEQRDLSFSMSYNLTENQSIGFHAVHSLTPGIISHTYGASFSTAM